MAPRIAPIVLHDLTLGYDGHPAVHHLSGRIEPGTLLAVVGPNGAGKSTLVKALAGLLRPLSGRIDGLAGVRVAYLPQQATLERSVPISVFEVAAMGLWHEVGALGGFDRGQRARVHAALAQVGLDGFARQPVDALSGGQLQRTLFARLLLQDAPLMLLDEPFVGIDQRTTGELLTLLHGWHAEGRTVLAVLHDLQQVSQSFPQTLLLSRELIGWGATAAVLTPAALARARQMPDAPDAHAPLCDGLPPAATDAGAGAPQAPERGHEYRHGHGPHPHGHAHRPQADGAGGTP